MDLLVHCFVAFLSCLSALEIFYTFFTISIHLDQFLHKLWPKQECLFQEVYLAQVKNEIGSAQLHEFYVFAATLCAFEKWRPIGT